MLSYFSESTSQIFDGLLFGLGVLAIYLGVVFTGALIRSLGGAGSAGLTVAGRYIAGWVDYLRGDDRNTINVTLNMVVANHLKIDTLVADHRVWSVWPDPYRVQIGAPQRTTAENPVLEFPVGHPPLLRDVGFSHRGREVIHGLLASAHIVANGRAQRVRLMKEDDYRAAYGPLISLVSEKTDNDNAIDLALGRPMQEYRFVIALTFERLNNRRARHLRAMVMWEDALLDLPPECPSVDFEEHKTRFRTLQAIARQYRTHPERFGIVKFWRPREVKSGSRRRAELMNAAFVGGGEQAAQ